MSAGQVVDTRTIYQGYQNFDQLLLVSKGWPALTASLSPCLPPPSEMVLPELKKKKTVRQSGPWCLPIFQVLVLERTYLSPLFVLVDPQGTKPRRWMNGARATRSLPPIALSGARLGRGVARTVALAT